MSMLTYLVKKHRCGVINCCFPEVKDMYLVPLQGGATVPPQLLPFKGPGHSIVIVGVYCYRWCLLLSLVSCYCWCLLLLLVSLFY